MGQAIRVLLHRDKARSAAALGRAGFLYIAAGVGCRGMSWLKASLEPSREGSGWEERASFINNPVCTDLLSGLVSANPETWRRTGTFIDASFALCLSVYLPSFLE